MRRSNPEWDFMGRTFLAYSLAEMALREPAEKARHLAALDAILDDTLRRERDEGLYYFLMPYARARPSGCSRRAASSSTARSPSCSASAASSSERGRVPAAAAARVEAMIARMKRARCSRPRATRTSAGRSATPSPSPRSRRRDCWTGRTTGTSSGDGCEAAKAKLVDPATGLLVSSYTLRRAHPTTARRARASGWRRTCSARWIRCSPRTSIAAPRRSSAAPCWASATPASGRRRTAGPRTSTPGRSIPGLDVSGGSSGLAFVAASSFGDHAFLGALTPPSNSPRFRAMRDGHLRYAASNQVGDAVVLYSKCSGRLWDAVAPGRRP